MWCVAELDEEYIARMEDVLAVGGPAFRVLCEGWGF
jgi:hypothetical protein